MKTSGSEWSQKMYITDFSAFKLNFFVIDYPSLLTLGQANQSAGYACSLLFHFSVFHLCTPENLIACEIFSTSRLFLNTL